MENLTIHVLLPNSEKVTYEIPNDESVQYLIDLMLKDEKVKVPQNKIISIIYRGRILKPEEILSHFDSLKEFSVHAFFKLDPSRIEENTEETENSETTEFHELRGFDRLRRMNLSAEQIATLRRNFHALNNTTDSPINEQIDLEEEWLPTIFNQQDYLAILQQANLGLFSTNDNAPGDNNNAQAADQATNGNDNENGLANQYDDLDEDDDLIIPFGGFWLHFSMGFIIGLIFDFMTRLIFGIFFLVMLLFVYKRIPFVIGLLLGAALNFYITLS